MCSSDLFELQLGGQRHLLSVYRQGERATVFGDTGHLDLLDIDPIAHAGDHGAHGGGLSAPMPGKVIALHVAAGEAVKAGQALAVMEAMKMEHTLAAPRDGVVAELLCAVGDQVGEGAELLTLAEE